jgi:hypothetical protein
MSQKIDIESNEEKTPMTSPQDSNNKRVKPTEMINNDRKTTKTLFNKIKGAKTESGDNIMDFISAMILIIVGSSNEFNNYY